jgi:hypothetical protein
VPPAISPTTFAFSIARTIGGVAVTGASSRHACNSSTLTAE